MWQFKEIRLEDQELVRGYLALKERKACQENFVTMYMWAPCYRINYCEDDQWLIMRNGGEERFSFQYPIGRGNPREIIEKMERYAHERGQKLMLWGVLEEQKAVLAETFPGKFSFDAFRDSWDYVYKAEHLADLKGNKYHGKRNFINRFISLYPEWSVELIHEGNIEEIWAMNEEWCKLYGCLQDKTLKEEICATERCLESYRELGVLGLLLRAGGSVAAYSIASPLGTKSFNIHIEKAFHEIPGAYPMINREMVRLILSRYPDVQWINREDDAGKDGLRKAKKSYHPDIMVEKYVVKSKVSS